jgi:hypothetical protein
LFCAFGCRFLRPVRHSTVPSAREVEPTTLTGDGADSAFYCNGVSLAKEARYRLVAADFAEIVNQSFDALAEYIFHFFSFSILIFFVGGLPSMDSTLSNPLGFAIFIFIFVVSN